MSFKNNYLLGNHWKYRLQEEKEHLRKLANKITKVPEKINIPIEYLVDQKEGKG